MSLRSLYPQLQKACSPPGFPGVDLDIQSRFLKWRTILDEPWPLRIRRILVSDSAAGGGGLDSPSVRGVYPIQPLHRESAPARFSRKSPPKVPCGAIAWDKISRSRNIPNPDLKKERVISQLSLRRDGIYPSRLRCESRYSFWCGYRVCHRRRWRILTVRMSRSTFRTTK